MKAIFRIKWFHNFMKSIYLRSLFTNQPQDGKTCI